MQFQIFNVDDNSRKYKPQNESRAEAYITISDSRKPESWKVENWAVVKWQAHIIYEGVRTEDDVKIRSFQKWEEWRDEHYAA